METDTSPSRTCLTGSSKVPVKLVPRVRVVVMRASAGDIRFREGAGRLCLDFIRTLRYRGTTFVSEELVDGRALAAWARQCGPCEVDYSALPSIAQVEGARELRETVHELITMARLGEG